jgi:hypothetical protein
VAKARPAADPENFHFGDDLIARHHHAPEFHLIDPRE